MKKTKDWLKENVSIILWLAGIVFIAGEVFTNIRDNAKDITAIKTQQKNQDDYNENTDQKIDDVKATQNYENGFRDGVREERQILLFELTLMNSVKK